MLGSIGIHLPINNLPLASQSIPRASAAAYVPPCIQPQHLGLGGKFRSGWMRGAAQAQTSLTQHGTALPLTPEVSTKVIINHRGDTVVGFLSLSSLISSSQVKDRPQLLANGKEEERMGSRNTLTIHQPAAGAHQRLSVGKAMEATESSAAKPPAVLIPKKPGAAGVPTPWTARETQKQGQMGKAKTLQWPFP